MVAEAAQEIEAALTTGTEQGVCAAAVETCLWFGLSLGELLAEQRHPHTLILALTFALTFALTLALTLS